MTFAKLFGLAALVAVTAGAAVPAFAVEDDEPARVSRNWNKSANTGTTATRGTAANQRGSTRSGTVARNTSNDDAPKVTYAQPSRNSHDDYDDNEGYGRRRHYGHHGLDPAEAARIRNAHRQSDRHVTLRRDYDYYGVPYYRTPSYRRHWWSYWW